MRNHLFETLTHRALRPFTHSDTLVHLQLTTRQHELVRHARSDIYTNNPFCCSVPQMPEVQHQTDEQRAWLLAEYPVGRLYQLKRKCNGCQEQDLSLLEGELVALLEDTDPLGSSSRWLVHTGGKCRTWCLLLVR